jgi:general L-amino acid transport system permease protein
MNATEAHTAPSVQRAVRWLRLRLFPSWPNAAVTLAILYLACNLLPRFFNWAFLAAVWSPQNPELCRQAAEHGACWAFIADKYRFILFGVYPAAAHWRPACVIVILLMLYVVSSTRVLTPKHLALFWTAGLAGIATLMWGGILGLVYVENERWGGLTLTLLLATFGIGGAFPIAILLALGRRSELPLVRWLCVVYIELIRGVPLISLLFMTSVMLPLFLPAGVSIDKLLRAQLAMIGFAAAYLAEVVRGGLQAIPRQQEEAAQALGLGYWQRTRYVILPQALRLSIPPLVNTFIGFFKDTSLVVIIGLYDFLTTIKVSLGEPAWTGFGIEAYLFAAFGYFLFCYPMSRYSQALERNTGPAESLHTLAIES